MSEVMVYAAGLVNTGALIFLLVYYVITLTDLECDYLNAQQCCAKLNFWLLPKLIAHFLPVVMLIGCWEIWLLLTYVPISIWHLYEYFSVPGGGIGVYDPTEIYNRGELRKQLRRSMVQLAFYFILFFVYLYLLIMALLKINTVEKLASPLPEF